jgi:hypothetical protein
MVRLRHKRKLMMKSIATALALMLAATPGLAEPFVLVIHESPDQIALRSDPGAAGAAYWAAYAEFGRQATEAGILRGGAALVPQAVAGVGLPLETGSLVLGGFFQIDVADAAEAAAWAARLPAATTGSVEVRAAVAAPGM